MVQLPLGKQQENWSGQRPTHIALLSELFTDLSNGTLPAFAYIEPGYGISDEHPGSEATILAGQQQVAKLLNAFMASPSWKDSVFFFSYDEGGGPFDHVPPVPGHTNDFTDAQLGITTDVRSIAANPNQFLPCMGSRGTLHCDLQSNYPGANPSDAAAEQGFAAQIGFRLPNIVISPFTGRHYVAHTPMDHTAIIKFVEDRFIGDGKYLTARDSAQPGLNEFFDFVNVPWSLLQLLLRPRLLGRATRTNWGRDVLTLFRPDARPRQFPRLNSGFPDRRPS